MSESLQPYPDYRTFGAPWLSVVPKHWDVLPARAVFTPKLTKNSGMSRNTVLSLSFGHIVVKPAEKLHGLVPESFESYQLVEPGDIVVRTTDLQNDQRSLRVGLSPYRGIITSAYLRLRTTDRVSAQFGYELLNTYDLLKVIYGFGSGLRQNLDFGDIKQIPMPVPPLSEQAAIVRFLDHADRLIRRYITAKRTLIALVQEQRKGVINRVFSGGVAPHTDVKASGLPWWPIVPERFAQTRLGRLCLSIRDGTHDPPAISPGIHRLLSVRNVIGGEFVTRDDDRTMSPDAYAELQRSYTVERGDIVLALVGATTGKSAVVGQMQNVSVQRSLAILRPDPRRIDSAFLNLALASDLVQTQIRSEMSKYAAQPGIYLDYVGRLQVAFPGLAEQRGIVQGLHPVLNSFDGLMDQAARAIRLMTEYRTRLIADAVTGRLDVQQAATRLPAATEVSEPLDEVPEDDPLETEAAAAASEAVDP